MKFLIALIIQLLACNLALADEAYSFKDLKLGASKDELNLKQFRCQENKSALGDEACYALKDLTIAGQPANFVALYFFNKTLSLISVTIEEKYFSKVESAMMVKYGSPNSQTVSSVKNRMGASFDNKKIVWANEDSTIRAEQRSGKVSESSIRYMLNSYSQQFSEREKAVTSNAAGDL